MKKLVLLLMTAVLLFSLCGCSESKVDEPPVPNEPVRIEAGSWPQNEYTESLPQPASGSVTNGWVNEAGEYCYIELSGVDQRDVYKRQLDIHDEENLITIMSELCEKQRKFDRISAALDEVNEKGYGIVTPSIDELHLEEPEIVKQGGRFGVKLKASAPSIHMIRADIETEVSPIVGSEKQSEDLVRYLLDEDVYKRQHRSILFKQSAKNFLEVK